MRINNVNFFTQNYPQKQQTLPQYYPHTCRGVQNSLVQFYERFKDNENRLSPPWMKGSLSG